MISHFRDRARNTLHVDEWDGLLFWVNAGDALRARLANPRKSLLEQRSGIIPLECQLVELLSHSDEFLKSVPRVNDMLSPGER